MISPVTTRPQRRTPRSRLALGALGLLAGLWAALLMLGLDAVAGVLWLRFGLASEGPASDAQLHALFLGFVIGMVMAQAPVIVPAVFRAAVPYRTAAAVRSGRRERRTPTVAAPTTRSLVSARP